MCKDILKGKKSTKTYPILTFFVEKIYVWIEYTEVYINWMNQPDQWIRYNVKEISSQFIKLIQWVFIHLTKSMNFHTFLKIVLKNFICWFWNAVWNAIWKRRGNNFDKENISDGCQKIL